MNARGFTLLEVLVALAILGVAVVASIQGFAQGLRLLKLAGDHQEAMLVADQKVREVVQPMESREEGTETRFQWRRTITRVSTPELADVAKPIPWSVYQIDVHVMWDERREIHLATLRTILNTNVIQVGTPTQPGQPTTPGQPTQPGQPGATAPTTPGTQPPTLRPTPQTPTFRPTR